MDRRLRYLSTRGEAAQLGFDDVLLAGLATDGGLYTPLAYPRLAPSEIAGLAGRSYAGSDGASDRALSQRDVFA